MQVASGAVHYVLGLWSRMVAAVPYVRVDTTADPMLDAFVPKVWLPVAQYRHAFLMAAHSLDNSSQCEPGRGGGGQVHMNCALKRHLILTLPLCVTAIHMFPLVVALSALCVSACGGVCQGTRGNGGGLY